VRIPNPLRAKLAALKVGGPPLIVKTNQERLDAHYFKRMLGMEIITRSVLNGQGWEIHRKK
jgi:hypothetical protein